MNGLFLTSGVPGRPVRATDRMLATVEILRRRERFDGYVHVKLLPGAETGRDLAWAGVDVVRAGYFLTLRGRRPATTLPPRQLRLFPAGKHLTQAVWKTSSPPCAYR